MNKIRLGIALGLILGLTACGGDRIYEDFQVLEDQSWSEGDTLTFDLSGLSKTGNIHLIGLRYTDTYPYTNAYLKLIGRDSSNRLVQEELVNVILFDPKSGQPKGKGFGDTHTIYDTLDFQLSPDLHTVEILQYMRKSELEGMEAVGLKILK